MKSEIEDTMRPHEPSVVATLPPILVADDDEDDRYFTMRLLKRIGSPHPIISFADGLDVVDYLSKQWLDRKTPIEQQPRLLFLDLKMPGLNGFAFLEWVREHKARAPLNIVILSGSSVPEDIERAKRLGAKRYLVKHPSLATFTTIVHDVHRPDGGRRELPDDAFLAASSTQWQEEIGAELRRR
jgi:CheY-like chemotaxis protein